MYLRGDTVTFKVIKLPRLIGNIVKKILRIKD